MRRLAPPLILSCLFVLSVVPAHADEGRIHRCATSDEVRAALEVVEPGDTIMLDGGTVYEIDRSLRLRAQGTADERITLTSHDAGGEGRYAVISTPGQRKRLLRIDVRDEVPAVLVEARVAAAID